MGLHITVVKGRGRMKPEDHIDRFSGHAVTVLCSLFLSIFISQYMVAITQYINAGDIIFLWIPMCTVTATMVLEAHSPVKSSIFRSAANCLICTFGVGILAVAGVIVGHQMAVKSHPLTSHLDPLSGFYVFTAILPIAISFCCSAYCMISKVIRN